MILYREETSSGATHYHEVVPIERCTLVWKLTSNIVPQREHYRRVLDDYFEYGYTRSDHSINRSHTHIIKFPNGVEVPVNPEEIKDYTIKVKVV